MQDPYSDVPELNLIAELERELDGSYAAEGFALTDYRDDSGLTAGWSADPAFLSRLVPFAQANGSGSIYALWRVDDRSDLAALPVVVFGDEGGQHVVARDLREFLRLLGYDTEISVDHDSAYFHRLDDHEPSDGHPAYLAWLEERFGLAPADDPDEVVAAAQAEFGGPFADWARPFLAHWG
ncbi:hypothetical protein [Kitasatospora sp. NPDC057015]|uniref:hypothetical protein n=1 Tax=Kitasatospora sp. NPDC057015 TaxID=3346001 RepID=UPI0036253825